MENEGLSILIASDGEIRRLNRKYFRRDRPTNVISFPLEAGAVFPQEDGPRILGDVVVSTDTASREAREAGISLEERFAQLLIHGVLHLLGYAHEKGGREMRKMERKEKRLFDYLVAESVVKSRGVTG